MDIIQNGHLRKWQNMLWSSYLATIAGRKEAATYVNTPKTSFFVSDIEKDSSEGCQETYFRPESESKLLSTTIHVQKSI